MWFFSKKRQQDIEKKESQAGRAIARLIVNQKVAAPRDYETFSREGYMYNVVAYRCVKMVSEAVASVDWRLKSKRTGQIIEQHPAIDLLRRPNAMSSQKQFIEGIVSFKLISGNAYIEATTPTRRYGRPPEELWLQRPDRMSVVAGETGLPAKYRFENGGEEIDWEVDPITGQSLIYHVKEFHPLDDWYGLAGTEPASFSIDQHNAAGQHNASLLENSASPSGVLMYKQDPGVAMLERAKIAIYDEFTRPENAGKPMVLGGDAAWTQMGMSPKDLDMTEGIKQSAIQICLGFGVPPVLVLPLQATFNNMDIGRMYLWEDTVLPCVDDIRDGLLNSWLAPQFGDDLMFDYDIEDIPALVPRRNERRARVVDEWQSGLITRTEAREKLGYEALPSGEGDVFHGEGGAGIGEELGQLSAKPKKVKLEQKNTASLAQVADEIDQPAIRGTTEDAVRSMLADLVNQFGEEVIEEIGNIAAMQQTSNVQNYIATHSATLVTQVNDHTKRLIRQEILEGVTERESVEQIKNRIRDTFDMFTDFRSQRIAITETTSAAGFAAEEAIKQSGVQKMEWISTLDGQTRDVHAALDGQVVQVGDKFKGNDGDSATRPGGFNRAGNNINCRCAIAAAFDDEERAMTFDQRRALFEKRDKNRTKGEKQMAAEWVKLFNQQLNAILKRIDDITT